MNSMRFLVGVGVCFLCQAWAGAQTLSLDRLIERAIDSHPSVRSQLSNEKSAQSGIETAKYQRYPTPQLSLETVKKSNTDTTYIGGDGIATIRITQPIFNGGLFNAQSDKAKGSLLLSQAGVNEARRQIALRVVQAYAEWVVAELKAQSVEKSLVVHQKLLQQAKSRISEGVSPASDLSLIQGRLDTTSAELFSAKLQADLSVQKLSELTDTALNSMELKKNMTGAWMPSQKVDSLLANAQLYSPELQKAKAQALISQANVQEKESALKPDIYVRAERQYGNYFSSTDTGAHNRIFLGMTSKFGPGFSSLTQISSAKYQDEASEFDVLAQQKLIREQVLNDLTVLQSIEQRVQAIEGALQASAAVFESFERQFNSGRKTWLDLMTVVRDVVQNEIQLADIRGSELQSSWRLRIVTSDSYFQKNPKP
jgi:adhesin transport system outer membrane protein